MKISWVGTYFLHVVSVMLALFPCQGHHLMRSLYKTSMILNSWPIQSTSRMRLQAPRLMTQPLLKYNVEYLVGVFVCWNR